MTKLTHLHLENFTAFKQLDVEFSPGINILLGKNGTGKTHVLKVLYAIMSMSDTKSDSKNFFGDFDSKIIQIFMPSNLSPSRLERSKVEKFGDLSISLMLLNKSERIEFEAFNGTNHDDSGNEIDVNSLVSSAVYPDRPKIIHFPGLKMGGSLISQEPRLQWCEFSEIESKVVYIPAKEFLEHSPGFRSSYALRELAFSVIYDDLLIRAQSGNLKNLEPYQQSCLAKISQEIGGDIILRGEEFFLKTKTKEIEFTLLAEGFRKLGMLWVLIRNGSIDKDSVLFWDEPEANLNPSLLRVVVEVLLELQRAGTQIFLATHSDVLLSEFKYRSDTAPENQPYQISYHSFYHQTDGENIGEIAVNSTDNYDQIEPNAIAETYNRLYDQEINRVINKGK